MDPVKAAISKKAADPGIRSRLDRSANRETSRRTQQRSKNPAHKSAGRKDSVGQKTAGRRVVIRTSGEHRISNFLLWELAYSELVFTDVLWPDFRREHLFEAIRDYQKRTRRFGAVAED